MLEKVDVANHGHAAITQEQCVCQATAAHMQMLVRLTMALQKLDSLLVLGLSLALKILETSQLIGEQIWRLSLIATLCYLKIFTMYFKKAIHVQAVNLVVILLRVVICRSQIGVAQVSFFQSNPYTMTSDNPQFSFFNLTKPGVVANTSLALFWQEMIVVLE